MVIFIAVPKNSGLKQYIDRGLDFLAANGVIPSKIIEVRGEDIPFWIKQLKEKGELAIGMTGEDLYKEYCLEDSTAGLKVLNRLVWDDPDARFRKPALCLMGPKDKSLSIMPKNLTVCIASKYKLIAKKYLNFFERRGFVFKKMYVNGSVEAIYAEGIADLIIDIVYTGSSMEGYGLKIFDKILESDFMIIADKSFEFSTTPRPKASVRTMQRYSAPPEGRKGKLRLDFNENTVGCSPKVIEALRNITPEDLSIYPEYDKLKEKLANYLDVDSSEIMLSDGTDEAIKIVFDTYVDKGEEVILPVPTFSMFASYAQAAGAKLTQVLYKPDLSFPTDDILKKISNDTRIVVLVNPNNPTGTAIDESYIIKIVEKASNSIVLIDEAYFQFYGKSAKDLIKRYDNVIVTQTFSKAFGLAGLRLGYAIANKEIIADLQKVIPPYSVNSIAVKAAIACLDDVTYIEAYASEVISNRDYIVKQLNSLGVKTYPSQANFMVAYFGANSKRIAEQLSEKGILVRDRSKDPLLQGCVRIGIGNKEQSDRFLAEIGSILPKKVLIFDVDGVLADVSGSYRTAIKETAEFFTGKEVSYEQIQSLKGEGGFNNDWVLTQELVRRYGMDIPFEQIKERFQKFYLGDSFDGLISNERLLLPKEIVASLRDEFTLGIVTGRPREEAEFFLRKNMIIDYFDAVVCLEDVEEKGKPDPFGINLALERLNSSNAFYFGDTIDDMRAATSAGIVGIGVIPPMAKQAEDLMEKTRQLLIDNKASVVLEDIKDIMKVV